ncbi:hypothetical protein COU57_02155 [Candidatus Pacearchaeota archaeon CG10_big_fil_rev_8_21_14_0_10_32_14]|nr:MAG: hypothetical protein COU57_02155 [Candidatus Pacearchaeota archaeon CG10_big_fil_rev_8_21_14_0_10_32_14]
MVDLGEIFEDASREMDINLTVDPEFLKKFQENISIFPEDQQVRICRAYLIGYMARYEVGYKSTAGIRFWNI